MILLWLMLVLAPPARASEPPFYLRETAGRRDVGGINENDRALADSIRRTDLTNGGSVAGSLTLTGTGNGIVFPDGTTQTTAVISTTVARSTCVYIAAGASFQSTTEDPNVALATATLTITANSRIRMEGRGSTASGGTGHNFLINGAFFAYLGRPACDGEQTSGTQLEQTSCWKTTEPLSAGTYDIGWAVGDSDGAGGFYNGAGSRVPVLCAYEIKTQ